MTSTSVALSTYSIQARPPQLCSRWNFEFATLERSVRPTNHASSCRQPHIAEA